MSSSQETELQDLALPRGPPQTKQSIVPQLLIDHYVSMIDPSRAQTVDHEIARHCAFSLPVIYIFHVYFLVIETSYIFSGCGVDARPSQLASAARNLREPG